MTVAGLADEVTHDLVLLQPPKEPVEALLRRRIVPMVRRHRTTIVAFLGSEKALEPNGVARCARSPTARRVIEVKCSSVDAEILHNLELLRF